MPVSLTFRAAGSVRDGVFTPAAHRRVDVEVRDGERVIDRFQVNTSSPRSRKQAEKHGIEDAEVIRLCDESLAAGTPATWVAVVAATIPVGHLTVTTRGVEETGGESHTGPAKQLLQQLLPVVTVERLLTWTSLDPACCLDIDYHATAPPIRSHLETWIETRLRPKPALWHFSRGGGAHCFYVATDRFTAEELAASAALSFRQIDPSAGTDLVSMVRGAGDEKLRVASQVSDGVESTLPGANEELDGSSAAVSDWLETNGLQIGARYDHDKCPIAPSSLPGQRQPVLIGETGVWCFSCAARGLSLGSRKPGFATYAAITGQPGSNDVALMIRNKVHWGHARWVLTEKYELPERLARLAYGAALKAAHEEMSEDEVAHVFLQETEDMARSGDSWVNLNSSNYHYPTEKQSGAALVGTLPACLFRDEKGKLRTNPAKLSYLVQGHDLGKRGYGNLNVVRGFRLARQFLPPPVEAQVSVMPKELRGMPRAPKYVPRSQRKSTDWAEGVFERVFPGVSWLALRSQVCAVGCAQEIRQGLLPITFLAGPSGSAKTTTMKIAAGMLGTTAPEVTYNRDEEKMKRSVQMAGMQGGFALCNEFLKDYKRQNRGRFEPRVAMETILNLTPEALVHVMYVGPRPLGRLPAIVFAEPKCPHTIRDYRQIARRVRFVGLFKAKDAWKENMAALGLTHDTLHLYRLRDAELAEAADVVVSDLIDRYFSAPMSWDVIADSLGCPTIENSSAFDDTKADLKEFFKLVCDAPELAEPSLQKRYPGYKRIHRAEDGPLVDAWNQFADEGWFASEIMGEQDWDGLIGTNHEVVLTVKSDGVSSVYVRFHVGPVAKPVMVNGEILKEVRGGDTVTAAATD